MKTRISIYSVLVLAALAISAVSCNRMIDEFDAGGPIRFSAGTEYDNGPFTRTEYSGIVSGTSTLKERINWVKNDPITINYKQEGESSFQTGKYKIKDGTITTSGASSVASIEPVTDELYWGENSSKSHVFYAMYPSKGFGGNNKADLVGNTVSGYIPDTQVPTKSGNKYIADMKYAYMVAMATVGYTLPPSVQLPFCPAFTAFHFEINSDNSAAITVSKFELEADTNLAGEFSFDITGGNASGATWTASSTTVTNGVKKITVDFSASPVSVNNTSKFLDLTVLALPIQQSGLKITLTTSNGPKVLRLNDASNNPVVFAPCKKYTISNNTLPGGESWTYTVGPIEDIKVYGTGFANEFHISDSTYVYPTTSPLIRADKVATSNDLLCYCTVNFPSRDAILASAQRRAGEKPSLWQLKVYLTKMDDSVTETVLDITEPLKAGDLKIIKGSLDDEGAVRPYDSTVGVSVTLDWNKGGTYDPEL